MNKNSINIVLYLCIITNTFLYGTTRWHFWQKEDEKVMQEKNETIADDIQKFIAEHDQVVIMFSLSNCPYCTYIEPFFVTLEKEFSGSVHFKMVIIDNKKEYYKKMFHFNTVPMVIYYKSGKEKKRHGSDNKSMTIEKMRTFIQLLFAI